MPNEGGGGLLGIPHADKLVHLSMYTGLSLLMCVWCGVRRHVSRALVIAAVVSCVLAGYAAFDEISQGPVGRDPDLRDWFADVAGINFGLFGFFAIRAWVRRRHAGLSSSSDPGQEPVALTAAVH
jgi:VanZ family protein